MTKPTVGVVLGLLVFVAVPACGGSSSSSSGSTGSSGTSGGPAPVVTAMSGIGDACIPSQETSATFNGFDEKQVSVETMAPTCKTGSCLVNHFRGRVSCPYGQDATGQAPSGATACLIPNTGAHVTGNAASSQKAQVAAQCVDRVAAKAVYCSCRCANDQGRTDDGATYCGCGDGFTCTNLVASVGPSSANIAGSYCIKAGTAYDSSTACDAGTCDPLATKCE
jgi:hypothetical protein